jgi:pilus assembly protein TadC
MWKKIRTKYLHTLFATGIAGIWGLLMGKDDWMTLFVDLKAMITFGVCVVLISFGVLTFVVTTIQKRREQNEILARAHGKTK